MNEEHRGQLDLLGKVESALGSRKADDDLLRDLVKQLRRQVEHDVGRHFDFEEAELFTRMDESGEGDITGLLAEEHDAIRDVAEELLPLTAAALDGTSTPTAGTRCAAPRSRWSSARWPTSRRKRWPCCRCWNLLDEETDGRLAMEYAC